MSGLVPAEPTVAPVLPHYGERSLPDLASSLLASLGVTAEPNLLSLPQASRACLLVVDGLGWDLLRKHRSAAPFPGPPDSWRVAFAWAYIEPCREPWLYRSCVRS